MADGQQIEVEVGGHSEIPLDKGGFGADRGGDEPNDEYFKRISQERALKELDTSGEGLDASEASRRLEQYGPNKLPEKKQNKLWQFLKFMWNPLSWAMEVAAIIAIALLDYLDFGLIIALLLCNACIGYYEESNAANAIDALMASLAPESKCMRDKKMQTIEAANLVPGDVILIRLGDVVPADCKILGDPKDDPVLIDQAALTGESLPSKKFAGDVAFSGSVVKQGEVLAVVYATGSETFFGKAAQLIGDTENESNLQKVMSAIGATCLITIAFWVAIELGIEFGVRDKQCKGGEGQCPVLTNMLVILIGGIPIAMPTVLSVTLALGAHSIAEEGAIVSRLTAVEQLAGMDMLCSDKTGTLTLNKLSVDESNLEPQPGFSADDILLFGALGAKIENNEPIDVCIHNSCKVKDELWTHFKCSRYVPFNPTDKKTVAYCTATDAAGESLVKYKTFKACKGAPQIVLNLAFNADQIRGPVVARIDEYASRGYRALGVGVMEGHDDGEGKWEFVGLIPIFDPPRHDTQETIERAMDLGIGVKMITGDALAIGKETARQLGMGTNMFTTEVFRREATPGGLVDGTLTLDQLVEEADGFAEVFPEHKYDIVRRLQDLGHITGMTGDGVNDAPALKKADIGVAVADATDAARAAADIVLTEPGLSIIVDATIGSREIFQKMKAYAKYTIATTFRICFTFGILTVAYNTWYFPTVLTLIMAICNDGAMISLSKDNVEYSKGPDQWKLKNIFVASIVFGLYLTLSTWLLFYAASERPVFVDIGMDDLRWKSQFVGPFCTEMFDLVAGSSDYNQCVTEIQWERASQLRALIYMQVSISGQALIFVVRTTKFSLFSRPGTPVIVAFFVAQAIACLLGGLGMNGYPFPVPSASSCTYCQVGGHRNTPPIFGTIGVDASSVIQSNYYVIVAWIWSAIWYFGLDPIKWLLMWFLAEDGFREKSLWSRPILEDMGFMRKRTASTPGEYVISGRRSSVGSGGSGEPSSGRRSSVAPGNPRRSSLAAAQSRVSGAAPRRSSVHREAGIWD
ncbi:Plasma membrane ATPase [Porphyridium purpureum]|uniref:Plasma membrane ATPase n=1 Tax=Porphyridium purpureum TaxID=35688 RepID=A0A5J4YZG4_PORPP|nr:Plasma membrane ATPase [Porphyridium purpureum]|eukprot:POR5678..scf209_3